MAITKTKSSISVTGLLILNSLILSSSLIISSSAKAISACGSDKWDLIFGYALTPIAMERFSVACVEHDACYDTLGKSQAECDKAFQKRMLGICARDHNTWLGYPLKLQCEGDADIYYSLVVGKGGPAYRAAQAQAQRNAQAQAVRESQSRANQTPVRQSRVGIDFESYCRRTYVRPNEGTNAWATLNGRTVYTWTCDQRFSNGQIRQNGIDVNQVCVFQTGSPNHGFTNQNDPYSWYCGN